MFENKPIISLNKINVFKKYEIKSYKAKRIRVVNGKGEEYEYPFEVIEAVTDEIKRTYNPILDTPELFTEILKIDLNNPDSILKFIHEYGIPRNETFEEGSSLGVIYNDRNIFHISNKKTQLEGFEYDVQQLQDYARIWEGISFDNKDIVEEFKNRFQKSEHFQEEWQTIKNESNETILKKYLVIVLNQHSMGRQGFYLSGNHIVPSIKFEDLTEIAWWQFANGVINNIYFKKCLNCGHVFFPQHGHQKFCPPINGRKISTCQNTYNQRTKRKRKKALELASEGYTAQQIADKLKRDLKEIQEWIN